MGRKPTRGRAPWEDPFKASEAGPSAVSHYGARAMQDVQARFSVDAYLRDYRYEPGNEALDLDDSWYYEDFTDWLATVPAYR
eukprot:9396279-Pyramimonas_sp.AAC.1